MIEAICVFKLYGAKVFVISYLEPKVAAYRKKNYGDMNRNWPIHHSWYLITKKFPQARVIQAHNASFYEARFPINSRSSVIP